MRKVLPPAFLLVSVVVALLLSAGERAVAAPGDTIADRVFGQSGSFSSGGCNVGGLSASSTCIPIDAAVDASGNLYVTDTGNSRVLQYNTPLTTDLVADRVFGKPDFTTPGPSSCASFFPSNANLCLPQGLALDGQGNLYVADYGNNRVLAYINPLANSTADFVFGQPSFSARTCNFGGISSSSLCGPDDVAVDASGNVYISERGDTTPLITNNSRILGYNTPFITDRIADRVFGQGGSFVTGGCNSGGIHAGSLCTPTALAVDSTGRLYAKDTGNRRALAFDNPVATDTTADRVYGQADNFTTAHCNGPSSITGPGTMCDGGTGPMSGIAISPTGQLYVSDEGNSRILVFDTPASSDTIADHVFGQGGSLTSSTSSCSPSYVPSAATVCGPRGMALDCAGNLFTTEVTLEFASGHFRMLEFDSPFGGGAGDSDCDTFLDAAPTLHQGPSNTNTTRDNCPGATNPTQLNADGNFIDHSPPYSMAVDDKTWPDTDAAGDACDTDDDNDGIPDAAEATGAACAGFITNQLLRDTDADRFLDGAECALGTDPTAFAIKPLVTACGATTDVDSDKLTERIEVCFYGTDPNNSDTDGDKALDGGKDGCEAASLNGDRIVNVADAGMLATAISNVAFRVVSVDVNKDGVWNPADQGLVASFISPSDQCPG